MTILDWFLILLGASIALPILAFLIVKWATVGFYRGKEAFNRQELNSVQDNENETES
jgi:hypothetical protein